MGQHINPYEEIRETLIACSKRLGYATFDYLPDAEQGYPFVMVGDQINTDTFTKTRTLGQTDITVHVFAEWNFRKDVVQAMEDILAPFHNAGHTQHFYFSIISETETVQAENTDNLQIWHGRLELVINYR